MDSFLLSALNHDETHCFRSMDDITTLIPYCIKNVMSNITVMDRMSIMQMPV
jgi:hypothetical protein